MKKFKNLQTCRVTGCAKSAVSNYLCVTHWTRKMLLSSEPFTRSSPNTYEPLGDICYVGTYNKDNQLSGFFIISSEDIDLLSPYRWVNNSGRIYCRALRSNLTTFLTTKRVKFKNANSLDLRRENLEYAK